MTLLLVGLTLISALYWLGALAWTIAFRLRLPGAASFCPPVTVLKPLCGSDPHLYENLRSFCTQVYPKYQVVFGTRDPTDPAIQVVNQLIREFPDRDLGLVVRERLIGTNFKVSNLANCYERAKYDVLVFADSDMRVRPDYLGAIVAPLEDAQVGMVTCLYTGVPTAGVWSMLGAMFINEWFFPSAVVASRLHGLRYGFGATMACRRETLEAIGGFESLADYLADDYRLGWLVARRGYRVVLSPYVVSNVVVEREFKTFFFHELRWARTFRTAAPVGYPLSVVTYGVPLTFLLLLASRFSGTAAIAFLSQLVLRLTTHAVLRRVLHLPRQWSAAWLVPVRDALTFALWAISFLGRRVRWNGDDFAVLADGRLRPVLRRGSATEDSESRRGGTHR